MQCVTKMQTTSVTERFNELFSELERCNKSEQRKKIGEANEIADRMNDDEFCSIFEVEIFNKISKMIEEKKMSMENAILLLKHIGYCKVMKCAWIFGFEKSSLNDRFEKMIIEESENKDKKNEKILIDLCECNLLLNYWFDSKLLSICVPCLLNFASKKEEIEEIQKEVEMDLLALSCIGEYFFIERKLYLNELMEVIRYHQEHQNLTQLAYQSAWDFLINRFCQDRGSEKAVANELCLAREATKELERLVKQVDLKRREGKTNGKEMKEMATLMRWLGSLNSFFRKCKLWNEEFVGLFRCISTLLRISRDNYRNIQMQCFYIFESLAENRTLHIDAFLNGGVIDAALEEASKSNVNFTQMKGCMMIAKDLSERLKNKKENGKKMTKLRSLKRKLFDKFEEEGFEDLMEGFYVLLGDWRKRVFYTFELAECFVYL
ncbi:uncharacterized protein MONOS_18211 [Monocercomonoides exilis]|uniref:uncharacterized protein n=1 Tax=Monocercomonoides exilis TaxID=2049356 RepID=UPI0035594E99|nr:hypothetical protein MONOS_18211 [Monocercomonoides exilis]